MNPQRKLAVVCTHPIQYYAPLFRALARSDRIDLRVFYTWSQARTEDVVDPGFRTAVKWDVPLLDGYAYEFVTNVAKRPGLDHFGGLDTPTLVHDLEAWRPDAILVYTWNSKAHLQALRYFKGRVPVLFRGDSTLLDHRPWWRAAMRRVFLTWVYSHVDVAIAVGSNNRDYFAWCGLPTARIALAPHSIDSKRFSVDARHRELAAQWRTELGIPEAALVVLFAGKFQAKKNPFLLLEAFKSVGAGTYLVFVGNGELESDLKAKVKADLIPNVRFTSFKNQSVMPAVYRMGDIFVLPSQGPGETWGLALNEAMASGRVVVASTKVGGARDLIKPGDNGWIFASGDKTALEDVLCRAIACGRARLHAMGQAGQAQSVEWSSEACASRIADTVLALPGP